MTLICYLTAGAVNLFWLILGDRLSLPVQMAIPILTVLLAGTGVLLRLRKLRGEQRRRYRTGALWVLLLYYLCILSVLLFFGGLFHLDRGYGGAVNLEPFHTIRNYIIYYRRTGSFVSVTNLLGIYAACSGMTPEQAEAEFAGRNYGALKEGVSEAVIAQLAPLQEKFREMQNAGKC